MRIAAESFRGEAPRVTPRALPENGAQIAKNARLQSGDLESWRQFALAKVLANPESVETIYLLNDEWLSWSVDVDAARGAIPGDNTYRLYLTAPDLYAQPRFTNYALATTGAEPFPVTTRPLGVPAPDAQPALVVGVSSTPSASTIEIIDSGDELTSSGTASWTTPAVVAGQNSIGEDAAAGQGPPSYQLGADNNALTPMYMYRDMGIEGASVVTVSWDFMFNARTQKRMNAYLMTTLAGAGIAIRWSENPGRLVVGISTSWSDLGVSNLDAGAIVAPQDSVWYTCEVTIVSNPTGTKTVTATLYQGSVQLHDPVVVTNAFTNTGGFMGFVLHIGEDVTPSAALTWYDNILVRGTVPVSVITQVATSYVYTFVNDLGEESAPSAPSATVLKDDGTSITITTAVAVPSGFSVDYSVETKRIYRSVTGNTGTVFAFVAEIPLAQADYVDELTDSELGDALETELWDLPPDDLRGILALPNGIMVGFRRNQLCFAVKNRPHAWPVDWRLNTDTSIVAIGNIDNTVVIGTEAFPYLAVGNDPAAYSMSKLEVPQACVSKQSLAYLTKIGVVFASPDGLIAISGSGQVVNLTEMIFTRRQWQALGPETMRGVAHDDVYHFWCGTSTPEYSVDDVIFDAATVHGTGWTFADGDSTAIISTTPGTSVPTVKGTVSHSTGKWYVEFEWLGPTYGGSDVVRLEAGLGDPASTGNPAAEGVGYRFSGTVRQNGSAVQYTGPAIAPNDILGIAVDLDTGDVWLSINGTYLTGDPVAGTSPAVTLSELGRLYIPIVSSESPVPQSWTIYGTPDVLNYSAPEGFLAWGVTAVTYPTTTTNGHMLDMKSSGFGLVELGYHAIASHADPLTDRLYLVLDAFEEPSEPYLSLPSLAPTLSDPFVEIYEFDSPDTYGDLVYQYKGKLNLLDRPAAFSHCQVKADDYSNLVMNLYGDGDLFFSQVITSAEPFTLLMEDEYEKFEVEFVGTSRVQTYQFVEAIEELK